MQGFEYIIHLLVQITEAEGTFTLPYLKQLYWKAGLSQHRYSLPEGKAKA